MAQTDRMCNVVCRLNLVDTKFPSSAHYNVLVDENKFSPDEWVDTRCPKTNDDDG